MTEHMLLIQALAAILAVFCAIAGWLAKSWVVRDQITAKDEIIRTKEEQAASLALQLQSMQTITPLQMREQILGGARKLDAQTEALQAAVSELESRRLTVQGQIDQRAAEVTVCKMHLIELEERRRSVQQFAASLRELVERRSDGDRSHFDPAENAMRATEADHAQVLAEIGDQQTRMSSAARDIGGLERDRAFLEAEIARTNHEISGLHERRGQLFLALEVLIEDQAEAARSTKPEESRAATV